MFYSYIVFAPYHDMTSVERYVDHSTTIILDVAYV